MGKDIPDFDAYKGVDLNPAKHSDYDHWGSDQWGKLDKLNASNRPPFWNASAKLSTCEISNADGSFYRIQEIGPLTSTGGYDFWQFGLKDVFGLSELLEQYPNGLIFDSSFSAAVLPD